MLERDERNVHAEKRNRLCQVLRLYIADVRSFHIDDVRIGAQAPRQLAVAHIDGVDLDRAILQHTVGKAARGRANVHADLAVRAHRKDLHGLFQLEAAAADIADVMPAHLDLGVGCDHLTGLVDLLLVDKDDAGHDKRLGALTALYQSVLAQVLIQANLAHACFSFKAFKISAQRAAASSC